MKNGQLTNGWPIGQQLLSKTFDAEDMTDDTQQRKTKPGHNSSPFWA